ncbi:MAG: winged helix-turn-helix domain-containing protein [Burkholderiaceae bacterium]|nr:winged helix-turn-helix domain-containing protein [Burkholderiaceae bacterium]
MPGHILIVEDEPDIRRMIGVNLRHHGFRVTDAGDAASARVAIASDIPDLIVLDWMLPDVNGPAFARELRKRDATGNTPILFLTARAQEQNKLEGFEAGADDYVTKPFSPRELLARISALLRRAGTVSAQDTLEFGGLRLEPESLRASAGGQQLELSPTEFRLLHCFMRNPQRILSRARLIEMVWDNDSEVEERTVDVHIRRLRVVLGATGHDQLIATVRGAGYRLEEK